MQISFIASILAVILYIVVSLLTYKKNHNIEQMLHRGRYDEMERESLSPFTGKFSFRSLVGINDDFSTGDKWISIGLFGYSMGMFTIFVIITAWNIIDPWPTAWWSSYWHIVGIGLPVFFAIVTAIWFTWGGLHDIRLFFERLNCEKVNDLDNGMVVGHRNMDDAKMPKFGIERVVKISTDK